MFSRLQTNERFRRLALGVQRRLNRDDPWARFVDASVVDGPWSPIFIVGAPRTGSTLLSEAMLRRFRLAYVPNAVALAPAFLARVARAAPRVVTSPPPGDIHGGYHGFVPGFRGPSEAGKLVDRWLREPVDRRQLRAHVAALSHAAEAPLLLKSLTLVQNLPALRSAFPGARYIRLRRDPVEVARSIVEGRQRLGVGVDEWWSVEPPGREVVAGLPHADQAAWQVAAIDALLDRELPKDAVFPVSYEAFCASPEDTLRELGGALGLQSLPWRPPARFDAVSRTEPELRQRLERALAHWRQVLAAEDPA